ncbi:alpha-ketoglutarate-dependent dioxygenase alkB homolog 6-like isoform X5 [Vespa crabro]|nr:alpha-ketoglutarate-dependent dioxygenase alkB homolog 6-like isoform X5 [Vespa crabro]XP_046826110.1 alpha-ketoglutarate-dependent dioxygenase alkB homolog 6-like isoform X5 [Vespa crabro]XP_046826112.1 alpha-ketoglutarate-dependent dioxygenase alkB homolog 6-like isoform X5 [Vespa crabro]
MEKRVFLENTVKEIPEMAQYIPNFITKEEEERIIKHINAVPLPKWTQLSYRRLQNWGGIPHPKGMIAEEIPSVSNVIASKKKEKEKNILLCTIMNFQWLRIYIDKITSLNVFERDKPPNHVLINEYLPSQGIMAHSDGPLFYPIVTTISCGSHTLLDFYKRNDIMEPQQLKLEFSLLLERRSLLILRGDLYNDYLHAIAETCTDTISKGIIKNMNMCALEYNEGQVLERGTRLSLTIRHVPKTSKLKLKIG